MRFAETQVLTKFYLTMKLLHTSHQHNLALVMFHWHTYFGSLITCSPLQQHGTLDGSPALLPWQYKFCQWARTVSVFRHTCFSTAWFTVLSNKANLLDRGEQIPFYPGSWHSVTKTMWPNCLPSPALDACLDKMMNHMSGHMRMKQVSQ